MNLPNKLTILRIIMIPFFVFFLLSGVGGSASKWIALVIFAAASITDTLDGYIARRDNLITDFGKFLDPLADKLLIIGTMLAILVRYSDNRLFKNTFVWALMIVLLRELAVTSLRMIASQKAGAVIAAGKLGKIKTVTQMVCMLTCLLEGILPAVTPLDTHMALSYLTTAVMTVMTLWSGLDYFRAYWKYLDPQK